MFYSLIFDNKISFYDAIDCVQFLAQVEFFILDSINNDKKDFLYQAMLNACGAENAIASAKEIMKEYFGFIDKINCNVENPFKIYELGKLLVKHCVLLEKIEDAISGKTKAIVVVHYAGVACEMDTIMNIAEKHGLLVKTQINQVEEHSFMVPKVLFMRVAMVYNLK